MHHHSRRLVDDDKVVVLVDDRERYVLWLRHRRHRRRNLDDDLVGFGDLHPGFRRDRAVDGDEAGLDQPLHPRAREVGMRLEDREVEPAHRPVPQASLASFAAMPM